MSTLLNLLNPAEKCLHSTHVRLVREKSLSLQSWYAPVLPKHGGEVTARAQLAGTTDSCSM